MLAQHGHRPNDPAMPPLVCVRRDASRTSAYLGAKRLRSSAPTRSEASVSHPFPRTLRDDMQEGCAHGPRRETFATQPVWIVIAQGLLHAILEFAPLQRRPRASAGRIPTDPAPFHGEHRSPGLRPQPRSSIRGACGAVIRRTLYVGILRRSSICASRTLTILSVVPSAALLPSARR